MVDEAGTLVGQVPLLWVGKTLSHPACVPATAVRLSTAAPALPSVGMLAGAPPTPLGMPLTFILSTCPGPIVLSALCPRLQPLAGCWARVSQTRSGAIGCNSPAGSLDAWGTKYPSTSAPTLTVPGVLQR